MILMIVVGEAHTRSRPPRDPIECSREKKAVCSLSLSFARTLATLVRLAKRRWDLTGSAVNVHRERIPESFMPL